MRKLIPADTVDTNGVAWETTGENIRRGAKEFSENDVKAIVDIMFPVGSVFTGENNFILSVGTWEQLTAYSGRPVGLGSKTPSGGSINVPTGDKTIEVMSLRCWKRVS